MRRRTLHSPALRGTAVSWNLLSPAEGQRRARAAALKAIALDSTLADGHVALAAVLCGDHQFAPAEEEFKRAIQLNPGRAATHNGYAWCLTSYRRNDDAIREAKQAQDLDPLNSTTYSTIGRAYLHARRYREGLAAMEAVRGLEPDQSATHGWWAQLFIGVGDTVAGVRESRIAFELSGGSLWSAACREPGVNDLIEFRTRRRSRAEDWPIRRVPCCEDPSVIHFRRAIGSRRPTCRSAIAIGRSAGSIAPFETARPG